jgi:8-oxo-dGTP pyrophosphatase MutT (NUDIX family)
LAPALAACRSWARLWRVTEHPNLSWTVRDRRLVYDNPWIRVELVDVEPPAGGRFEHHVVRLDQVAVALIVDTSDRVLTLWRYRFATEQWGYEIVGGLVEVGEEPVVTAARECVEETGWRPVGEVEHLVSFQPLPGMVDSMVHAFLWRGAEKVGEPTDGEEAARIEWVPVDRLVELVRLGEVLGAGAIVPILLYALSHGSAAGAAGGED